MNESVAIIVIAGAIVTTAAAVFVIYGLQKTKADLRQDVTDKFSSIQAQMRDELRQARQESQNLNSGLRQEIISLSEKGHSLLTDSLNTAANMQHQRLQQMSQGVETLTDRSVMQLNEIRKTLEQRLKELRESNERRLDEMRKTVDEQLQSTLEKRLSESFRNVSERLEAVHKGLGEMQSLAADVGGLKNVLTNVKVRGTWAEVQLGAILEQILTRSQYETNVRVKPDCSERVEFAIRLPGPADPSGKCVWLPIDSKFPQEDYLRLQEAAAAADVGAEKDARQRLGRAIIAAARDISEKYIDPPNTTDFAIMFLATEGLYAEVLRDAELSDKIQREYRVVIAGPTTLAAILSSLRMGFQTLAIERRATEVWQVLAAVKTEFRKFGERLEAVKKHLQSASNAIDSTGARTRAIERKLKDIEEIPSSNAVEILGLGSDGKDDEYTD